MSQIQMMMSGVMLLLVVSKLADVLTTLRYLTDVGQECNPWAAKAMARWGVARTVWGVFALSVALMGLALAWEWNGSVYGQWGFILGGTGVAAIQALVAHYNATRQPSLPIRWLQEVFVRWR